MMGGESTKTPIPRGTAVGIAVCCAGIVALAVYRAAWAVPVLCAAAVWAASAAAPRGSRRAAVVSMGRGAAEQPALPLGLRWAGAAALPSPSATPAIHAAAAAAMAFFKRRRSGGPDGESHGISSSSSDISPSSCSRSSSSSSTTSILDLPDLALDSILARLPAESLLRMGGVSRDFRRRCRSDHLWEALVEEKWGKIAGAAVYRQWRRNPGVESRGSEGAGMIQEIAAKSSCELRANPGWRKLLRPCSSAIAAAASLWDRFVASSRRRPRASDSLMAWYWAIETGTLWLRGQVFNRENGHVGFLLSCYDAELNYVRSSNTFRARYPPHGPRALVVEDSIPWERVRAPPVETRANELHVSDCLDDLKPGDHIEVQWRRAKEFPYGWWYGIVGHSESCSHVRNRQHCSCHNNNTIWLVFSQYTSESRWKRTAIDQRSHTEEGNETDGFYGGIRKLRSKDEIAAWKRIWPVDILE